MAYTESEREFNERMDARLEYLEELNRWHIFALDMVASLGELHEYSKESRKPPELFASTRQYLKGFLNFEATAFLTVDDEDSSFQVADCEPIEMKSIVQEELNEQISNGTFAWALNQNRAVVTRSETFDHTIILHVLATKSRIRGMFLGLLENRNRIVSDTHSKLLSIILQNAANVLESDELYELLNRKNQDLQEMVRERTQHIEHMSYHDALTGLPNRMLLKERLSLHIAQSRRNNQILAVMFLDLDRFNVINETMGHDFGDLLLREVAGRLSDSLRDDDTVARQGGDDFIMVLSGLQYIEDIKTIAQKILDKMSEVFIIEGKEIFIGATIGISIYPGDGDTVEALTKKADSAMYRAKEQGRNSFRLYSNEMDTRASGRLTLENALRKALEKEEFILYYQPKVDIKTGMITGMEALLRWRHTEMGLVSPAQFIPLAEETGLIVPIGEWVLHSACAQNKRWHNEGFDNLTVAVNISGRQFRHSDLLKSIDTTLTSTNLAPQFIEMELTESIAMQHAELTIKMLNEIKSKGINIAIDDFGTGYSSLSYLKRFSIDTLKIDRAFIKDIPGDADDAAIVTAVIAMSHRMNIKVVAEGVEDKEQLSFLRQYNCDLLQGYYFSPPVTVERFTEMLRSGQKMEKEQ